VLDESIDAIEESLPDLPYGFSPAASYARRDLADRTNADCIQIVFKECMAIPAVGV